MKDVLLISCVLLGYVSISFFLTKYAFTLFLKLNWVIPNYFGKYVVQSFGIIFFIHYSVYILLFYTVYLFSHDKLSIFPFEFFLFALGIASITIIGWFDDIYGQTEIKGLKGHLRALIMEQTFTSGVWKAIVGVIVALVITYFQSSSLFQWLFQTSLIVLSIHTFNLLDVRPGRAIKSFWFGVILLIPFYTKVDLIIYFLPILLSTMLMFHYERHYLSMLGDAGSNVLGFVYGFYLILFEETNVQFVFLLLFLLLSILAEKISFSEYIKKNPWLAKLDNWGLTQLILKD